MYVCRMDSELDSQSTERSMEEKDSGEIIVLTAASKQHPTNGPIAEHAHDDDGEIFETEIDSVDEDEDLEEKVEEYEVLEEVEEEGELEELVDDDIEAEYAELEELAEFDDDMEEQEENGVEEEEDSEVEKHQVVQQEVQEQQHVERRPPTQVPKKRKLMLPLTPTLDESVEKQATPSPVVEEEKSDVTRRSGASKDAVDEQQCRVCTAKEDLVSLFKVTDNHTIADLVMSICPSVSIAPKDYMPQFICNTCYENVTIAVQLKMQCETTERELRSRLSRSKNKVRRQPSYLVVDAALDSDIGSDNDDEFRMSDDLELSIVDDSEDSDFSAKRKRPARSKTGRKRGRPRTNFDANANLAASAPPKPKKIYNTMARKRSIDLDPDFSSNDERGTSQTKKKNLSHSLDDKSMDEYACDMCDSVFARKQSLILHKKAHSNRAPIECEICGKQFKIAGAFRTHVQRHKLDAKTSSGQRCNQCGKLLPTKADMRRHLMEVHDVAEVLYQCNRCKRSFVSETRLAHHQDHSCRPYESVRIARKTDDAAPGPDLFKSVAPMTTTYWSDSFSD